MIYYYNSPGKDGGGMTRALAVEVERVAGSGYTLKVEP